MKLPTFNSLNVIVVGDVMLDRYWLGSTDRISPEAPIPVVKKTQCDDRLGGAANVAYNIAQLGARASISGILGADENGERLAELMREKGLDNQCHVAQNYTTTTKLRVVSQQQQLLRVDTEEQPDNHAVQSLVEQVTANLARGADAIIISDYAKGALADPQQLIQQANAFGIPSLVDPKGSNFDIYRGATVLTPNRKELAQIVGSWNSLDELAGKAEKLRQTLDITALIVTMSEQGMLIVERGKPVQQLPARAREVFDVTGAGDTVIATLASCMAAELSIFEAAQIANQAAAIVVGKLGTASVSREELEHSLSSTHIHHNTVVSEQQLIALVQERQQAGETIVMTNGCFDLLHPGHLAYLHEAASLGDRLIIAVNSDASVKRLKGNSRPINPLQIRMEMLAALKGVDWVVRFDEDTPQRLISEVLPNVLVKGGDYAAEDIAGHDAVVAAGGSVKVLQFVDGYSSSALIEKIRNS